MKLHWKTLYFTLKQQLIRLDSNGVGLLGTRNYVLTVNDFHGNCCRGVKARGSENFTGGFSKYAAVIRGDQHPDNQRNGDFTDNRSVWLGPLIKIL